MSALVPALLLACLMTPLPSLGQANPNARTVISAPTNDVASRGEILAMSLTGTLFPDPEMSAQIDADLIRIEEEYRRLRNIHPYTDWWPGFLYLYLELDVLNAVRFGAHDEIRSLNEQYDVWFERVIREESGWVEFRTDLPYNIPVLTGIYGEVEGVKAAYPEVYWVWTEDLIAHDVGLYRCEIGWGDCIMGCIYIHWWEFEVRDGVVTLVEEGGAVPTGQTSWGSLKARYGSRQ